MPVSLIDTYLNVSQTGSTCCVGDCVAHHKEKRLETASYEFHFHLQYICKMQLVFRNFVLSLYTSTIKFSKRDKHGSKQM